MNDFELDTSTINPNGSISCNVTEHGKRRKIQKQKQKFKALKQGDVLHMESVADRQANGRKTLGDKGR